MKTCSWSFRTLRWDYGTFLSLVSVPLSSRSKETEGLTVFATASQRLSHGRNPLLTIPSSRHLLLCSTGSFTHKMPMA